MSKLDECAAALAYADVRIEWNRMNDAGKDRYRNLTRAVIACLREPTLAMADAAISAADSATAKGEPASCSLVYQAMLDAMEPKP